MDRFCFRCNKLLERPLPKYADYIIAEDTKGEDLREVFFALKHTPETLAKLGKEEIKDEEYERVEVGSVSEAVGAVKVSVETKMVNIQKTGLVCPDCYKDTDFVIWGMHKKN